MLLVFGGSQGAAALNEIALEAFGAEGPAVLHLCGERYLAALEGRVARPDYRLLPWTDDFGAALDAATSCSRAPAGRCGRSRPPAKPAVLVPSPNVTDDHQTKNARYFEAAGGAVVVPESRDLARPGGRARAARRRRAARRDGRGDAARRRSPRRPTRSRRS